MAITVDTNYLGDFISHSDISELRSELSRACTAIADGSGSGADFLGWRDLPFKSDVEELTRIKKAADRIRNDSDVLVVVGIGGSYLGSRAVLEFLGSQLFNEQSPLKVYFAGNNISGDYLNRIISLCDGKRVSVNIVSKSGTTTEPALAFRALKGLIEKQCGKLEAARRIYATTDCARGTLKSLADREGYECFVIPDDVGGRFSVLTAVGLLPLAAAGFDIDELLTGAAQAARDYADDTQGNPVNLYACARTALYRRGKAVETLACFEPSFAMFSEWWKQLFGESEGKEQKGLMPTSVIFSTDLHSMGQYIQDGARIMFETFLHFAQPISDFMIDPLPGDFDGLNYLAGSGMSRVNDFAMKGTILAHTEGGVPCLMIGADRICERTAGELIYFFERACAVSGYMLGVNPFNQPGVEGYKRNMFALLGKPGFEDLKATLEKKIK
ncbi:MAG: glucose-6-phosphate isomerase [Oscillospiraceae bacterium]